MITSVACHRAHWYASCMKAESPNITPPETASEQRQSPPGAVAKSVIVTDISWERALERALAEMGDSRPDVVFLFASAAYGEFIPALVQRAWEATGSMLLLGCTSSGIIGNGIEAEHEPALSMMALSLPGATLRPVRLTQSMLEDECDPADLRRRLGVEPDNLSGWLLLADPFRMDASLMLSRLNEAYPGSPMIGGLAAPSEHQRRTWVFLNGQVYGDGGIGLAVGGDYDIISMVTQGCEPIGEAWTISGVDDQWIESISNRPALNVLAEALSVLPEEMQEEAERNLVAGLAADEYRDRFGRGDFLIRNIVEFNWKRGSFALAARPRVGQTIQFHLRDAATASLDLRLMLADLQETLAGRTAVAGLLYACSGRGTRMFGVPDHDASEVASRLMGMPHCGIVAAGEIGPVGKRTFLHGFTLSLGVIATRTTDTPANTDASAGITRMY
ncbi:FIST C-terminal domain-containing protein [soil metagenome]